MSDYTTTPNLGLYKPTYDADDEMWGTHLNANADTLDHAFSPISGVFLPLAGGAMQGAITLAGDPVAALQPVTLQYLNANVGIGPFLPLAGGGTITNAYLRLDGPAGTNRPLVFSTATGNRWQINNSADAESGGNTGSNLLINAFSDSGGFIGSAVAINRGSGPAGLSGPSIYQLAPWRQIAPQGAYPNGTTGNWQAMGKADRQPAMPLSNNPLAVTAGSPVVTIYWPGAANPSTGWIGTNVFGTQTWINLQGVAAIGGITPSGWLPVRSLVDNDHFTVNWTANATSTVTAGGGAAVTVQPSYTTTLNRVQSECTTGAWGFPLQTSEMWEVNPDFMQAPGSVVGGISRYEQRWHWTVGPSDPAGSALWNITGIEWDLTNRGHDYGYQPNIYRANQPSVGLWLGPVVVPPWATGGGAPVNWGTVYTVFSGQNDASVLGVYNAFSCMPNSLVGQKFDPTGHGGVGVDLFGAYTTPLSNPFATTNGSAVVTVSVFHSDLTGMANGDQVYIPVVYTLNGVTFGNATYTIASVNLAAGTFTITGTGTATATGTGGGANVVISFLPLAPYAPWQSWGTFQHGLISAPGSRFLSGGIIETQPGNGILWNDGANHIASVNAAGSVNIDLTLNPAGTGRVIANGNTMILWGNPGAEAAFNIYGAAGQGRTVYFRSANLPRWAITVADAESSGNAGSNFYISRYADDGTFLGNAVSINRVFGGFTVNGDFAHSSAGWLGFYGISPKARQTVTGAKGGNAALTSLMAALAGLGLVIDSTT